MPSLMQRPASVSQSPRTTLLDPPGSPATRLGRTGKEIDPLKVFEREWTKMHQRSQFAPFVGSPRSVALTTTSSVGLPPVPTGLSSPPTAVLLASPTSSSADSTTSNPFSTSSHHSHSNTSSSASPLDVCRDRDLQSALAKPDKKPRGRKVSFPGQVIISDELKKARQAKTKKRAETEAQKQASLEAKERERERREGEDQEREEEVRRNEREAAAREIRRREREMERQTTLKPPSVAGRRSADPSGTVVYSNAWSTQVSGPIEAFTAIASSTGPGPGPIPFPTLGPLMSSLPPGTTTLSSDLLPLRPRRRTSSLGSGSRTTSSPAIEAIGDPDSTPWSTMHLADPEDLPEFLGLTPRLPSRDRELQDGERGESRRQRKRTMSSDPSMTPRVTSLEPSSSPLPTPRRRRSSTTGLSANQPRRDEVFHSQTARRDVGIYGFDAIRGTPIEATGQRRTDPTPDATTGVRLSRLRRSSLSVRGDVGRREQKDNPDATSVFEPPPPSDPIFVRSPVQRQDTIRPSTSQLHHEASMTTGALSRSASVSKTAGEVGRPLKSALSSKKKKSHFDTLLSSAPDPPSPQPRPSPISRDDAVSRMTSFLDMLDPHGAFDQTMAETLVDAGCGSPDSLLEMEESELRVFLGKLEKRRELYGGSMSPRVGAIGSPVGGVPGTLTPYQEATLPRRLEIWKSKHGVQAR